MLRNGVGEALFALGALVDAVTSRAYQLNGASCSATTPLLSTAFRSIKFHDSQSIERRHDARVSAAARRQDRIEGRRAWLGRRSTGRSLRAYPRKSGASDAGECLQPRHPSLRYRTTLWTWACRNIGLGTCCAASRATSLFAPRKSAAGSGRNGRNRSSVARLPAG